MKRYYSWDDEDYIGGTTYIEIDDGYATKQIAITPDNYIASNRKDKEHHFYLAEGLVDIDEIIKYGGFEISEQYFYSVWNAYKNALMDKWNETKERFPLGYEIEGIIEVFYPQGIVITISQDVFGITDYDKSRDSTNPKNLYPGHKMLGKVVSYDEENMWLVIDNPRVF
ncbi:hypothetical protein [Virgibacillus sp. YIM 98842]|uniref:hypothetical protein n=1 Tax=Virgibacillus sp. YIM 98842 TaxID=2663533 RepID=UPI0013D9E1D0|nr:hypothetical protein [Virgibacillus sp. YIM 98842]